MCYSSCRCSGRKPSAVLVILGLARPSPSNTQHSPFLKRNTQKEEYEGSIRGKYPYVFKLCIFLHQREIPLPPRAGRACSSTQLCRAETSTQSCCCRTQMESIHCRLAPCQGGHLPETDSQLAPSAPSLALNAQTSLFITVSITHKDFLLNQELHLNLVNPCNDLKHTLQVTRNHQTNKNPRLDSELIYITQSSYSSHQSKSESNLTFGNAPWDCTYLREIILWKLLFFQHGCAF